MSNENILLQTLGFDVAIDHPHTHVVKCCQMVKGERDPSLSLLSLLPSSPSLRYYALIGCRVPTER